MGNRGKRGKQKRVSTVLAKARFLRIFATCGNVSRSASTASVSRQHVYAWLDKTKPEYDPKFEALYNDAHENALDILEEEARRRAVDGWAEPVYQGGKKVGVVTKFSDTLLVLLLKGKRPGTFRDRQEVTGADGAPLQGPTINVSFDARLKPPSMP